MDRRRFDRRKEVKSRLRQIALKKEWRGKKVKIGEGGIWIEGIWWR